MRTCPVGSRDTARAKPPQPACRAVQPTDCRVQVHLDQVVALPACVVNRHARLTRCVLDRGVVIPRGLVVGEDPRDDAKWFRVSPGGVTLITQSMLDARAAKME